jgi:alpha-ketoglutarate-dependent taurine dioxygenase
MTAALTPDSTAVRVIATGADPAAWCAEHTDEVLRAVHHEGAVVLRGADESVPGSVATVRDALDLAPVTSRDEFAERDDLGDTVYGAPLWPGDREMCVHHERSYSPTVPGLLVMACLQRPDTGGDTLLADTAGMLSALPPELVGRFTEQGWQLVRHYRPFFGINWTTAFGTRDPDEVERICAELAVSCRWLDDGALRTAGRRPAIVRHPETGADSWFNQITFFSSWSVDQPERGILTSTFGQHGLPLDTRFGDGSPLAEDQYDALMAGYAAVTRRHRWQPGDVLLIDNIGTAHGRTPYIGTRRMAVAPCRPVALTDLGSPVEPADDTLDGAPA